MAVADAQYWFILVDIGNYFTYASLWQFVFTLQEMLGVTVMEVPSVILSLAKG